MIVLALPERIWTPDIVWEKEDSSDTESTHTITPQSQTQTVTATTPASDLPQPPPISPAEIVTPPALPISDPLATTSSTLPVKTNAKKDRTKSQTKYFSKDECAICMDSFARGDVVRILPCGHVFHKVECDEWLMKWRKLVCYSSPTFNWRLDR